MGQQLSQLPTRHIDERLVFTQKESHNFGANGIQVKKRRGLHAERIGPKVSRQRRKVNSTSQNKKHINSTGTRHLFLDNDLQRGRSSALRSHDAVGGEAIFLQEHARQSARYGKTTKDSKTPDRKPPRLAKLSIHGRCPIKKINKISTTFLYRPACMRVEMCGVLVQ